MVCLAGRGGYMGKHQGWSGEGREKERRRQRQQPLLLFQGKAGEAHLGLASLNKFSCFWSIDWLPGS